jgi:hypothetical protein
MNDAEIAFPREVDLPLHFVSGDSLPVLSSMKHEMDAPKTQFTHCLHHQLPEDQASTLGLVCALCKHRLYAHPPQGECRSYWLGQPGAYSLDREPCFVYVLSWDDFEIRSLHPAGSTEDHRSAKARAAQSAATSPEPEATENDASDWWRSGDLDAWEPDSEF